MSGYDIKREIEQSIGHFRRESYGQSYPVLRRLEVGGLVACDAAPLRGPTVAHGVPDHASQAAVWPRAVTELVDLVEGRALKRRVEVSCSLLRSAAWPPTEARIRAFPTGE